jgi:hypothetical protein
MEHVRALLRRAVVTYADETRPARPGSLEYVHVACTEYLTALPGGLWHRFWKVSGSSASDSDFGAGLTCARSTPGTFHHGDQG